MPEYAKLDKAKYVYSDISAKDIWEHRALQKRGCIELNETFYRENILGYQDEWLITIVSQIQPPYPEVDTAPTTMLKSIYFLMGEPEPTLKCGLLFARHESVLESFENQGAPQVIYVKDQRLYFLPYDALYINYLFEFLVRYEELSLPSDYKALAEPVSGVWLYAEYWKTEIGKSWKRIGSSTAKALKAYDKDKRHR